MNFDSKLFSKLLKVIAVAYIIMSVSVLSTALYNYQKGFHNIDLGWNLRYISAISPLNLKDKASDGNIYSPEELVHTGYKQQAGTLVPIIISSFVLGFCLRQILT